MAGGGLKWQEYLWRFGCKCDNFLGQVFPSWQGILQIWMLCKAQTTQNFKVYFLIWQVFMSQQCENIVSWVHLQFILALSGNTALVRSFSKVLTVNAMSQEDRIYEPLLKSFKTACRRRSLLAGEFLVWTSLCKASSKDRAVVARRQEA